MRDQLLTAMQVWSANYQDNIALARSGDPAGFEKARNIAVAALQDVNRFLAENPDESDIPMEVAPGCFLSGNSFVSLMRDAYRAIDELETRRETPPRKGI